MTTSRSACVVRWLCAGALAALVAGCQQVSPYQASPGNDEPGYTSWSESAAVFHVKFVGAPGAKLSEVRDLALLRAAELAHRAGSREFVIVAEHSRSRTNFVRHNTAPPASPFVGAGEAGGRSAEQRELEARSRSLITTSAPARVETPVVELTISTQFDATHRTMDSSAPFSVEQLRRELPAKYRVVLGDRG